MVKKYMVFAAILVSLIFPAGCKRKIENDQGKKGEGLANGLYLVYRASKKKGKLKPSKYERLVTHDYEYIKGEKKKKKHYFIVPEKPNVPLKVDEDPIKIVGQDGNLVLNLQLAPDQAKAFEQFTGRRRSRKVAIIIGGKVITAHRIKAPIKGGKIQISGCTDNGCNFILKELKKEVKAYKKARGRIYVTGNEPFTALALEMAGNKVLIISKKSNNYNDMYDAQLSKVEIIYRPAKEDSPYGKKVIVKRYKRLN